MISQHLIQSIGWTLIHSIWQGLAIYIVLKIAVRWTQPSDVRYGMGVAAMAVVLITSTVTFLLLNKETALQGFQFVLNANQPSPVLQSSLTIMDWINTNIIWLIRFWALGFVVGLLRIAAGLWYIGRLRRNAHPVQEEWMNMVKKLSGSLNINRIVAMAEAGISSPMVVGFMKPIILFPVGLLSGLSTEQVETILIHELSHIRRQDYIINLVQSVVETIFFFNPFALLMSSMIREERENCCDDMVIAKGISPIIYVRTLAQLEAARSSSTLALGFAGNKNQLLNRIKRIMENSAKNDWGKGRLAPVALLFLGLVCASWLSISSEKEIEANQDNTKHNVSAQDTSREDGLIVIKRGRNHNGWTVIEPMPPIPFIEGIPEIEEMPEFDADMFVDMDFEMPPIPEFPEMFEIPDMPFEFGEFVQWDSIPGHTYNIHIRDSADWGMFEKEFTMKFKEEFKDFYKNNRVQFDGFVQDLKRDEARRKEAAEVVDLERMEQGADMKHMSEMIYGLKRDQAMFDETRAREAMSAVERSRDVAHVYERQSDMIREQVRNQSLIVEDMARKTEDYKRALTELLAEDGYIKGADELEQLSINDNNGEMTVNGKKVEEADALKYRALRDTYFGNYKRTSRDSRGRNE